jgi:hypothetical protein
MDFQKYYRVINQEDSEIPDDPRLDGKTHSLEAGNRPAAYNLEVEKKKTNISWSWQIPDQ